MASLSSSSGPFDFVTPSASTFVVSSSGTKHPPFNVFINHCGQDVKNTLAVRIYKSLDATGLKVFLDKPELKYGDLLPKALEEAMATATICIAIFSEHYAESPWCLAELEYMVKTHKTIIPIFYKVDPSVLRWTVAGAEKTYIEAFRRHQEKNRYAPEALQRWKEALQQVSVCNGGIINSIDDEEKVVKDVVNQVKELMKTVSLEVATHPVALDEVVQDFDHTISLQSAGSRVKIIGIWGMGGSGKTTLAKEIFNRRCSHMHWSAFISNVRDAAGKGLLLEKQKILLKNLDVKADECLDNTDDGKQILKTRLSRSVSVLIVLDDVDDIDQLDALLPPKESFEYNLGDQSMIMVTTRDKNVLQQWGISATYKMRPLNATHARQLFCWHAFKQIIPQQGFEDLVEKFLNACAGLPLSLKVLGGQVCGESDGEYWLQTLNMYSQIPYNDITKMLKASYDALEKQEQQMFLDAACFFIGERRSAAIAAWDAEFNGTRGWDSLLNKCLVEEDEDGLIRMHDSMIDLGRGIANGQSPYRLCSPEQIINIHPQQEAIQVRGITNAVGDNCHQRGGELIMNTDQGQRILAPSMLELKIFVGNGEFFSREFSEVSKELIWLQCTNFEHRNLPPWLPLKNLRILTLSDSRSLEYLWAADADAPLVLRELVIRRCNSLAGFPSSIGHLRKLKKIFINDDNYVSCDALFDLPQEFCYLQSLEHLELRNCPNLSSLPSHFGMLTKLKHLNLRFCTKLEALPDSFKKLTLLQYLSLECCRELAIKSGSNVLENMTKLRYLNLQECRKLEDLRLPESVSLTELYLTDTSLKELPANIFHLTNLTKLEIGSEFLITLPTSVGSLSPLTTLEIKGCKKLKSLSDSLEHLSGLRDLTIEYTGVKCLPKSLIHLQSLRIESTPVSELSFTSWCMLKSIVLRSTKVSKISIGGDSCPALETLHLSFNDDLRELEALPEKLKTLDVSYCMVLKDIRGVGGLKELKNLQIEDCAELVGLPCFTELVSLENFRLEGSRKVKKIAGLEKLRSLRELNIEIDELPSFAEYTSLKKLVLRNCNKLEKIESLGYLKSLEELKISDCPYLEALPSLQGIASLKIIQLKACDRLEKVEVSTSLIKIELKYLHKLESIEVLDNIRSLENLIIHSCPKLAGLPGLAKLTSLTEFELQGCENWKKIESLEPLKSLEKLNITDCPELEVIANLSETTGTLQIIHLEKCHKLERIEGLKNIRSLEKLKIHNCPQLNGLPGLAELTSLQILDLEMCHNLKEIEDLQNTRSLEKFIISDCQKLEALPSLPKITSQQEFQLEKCHKLKKIEGLENIKSLHKLSIYDCQELQGFPGLGELTSLNEFHLKMCPKLEKIDGLEKIRSLEKLTISDCLKLDGVDGVFSLAELTSLQEFVFKRCYELKKIEGVENLRSLNSVQIYNCPQIDGLLSLAELPSVKNIYLGKCPKLKKLKICNCPQLDGLLRLEEFTSLKELELKMCPKLKGVSIYDCPQLDGLLSLAELPSLENIYLGKCPKLEKIEDLENIRSLEKLRITDSPELAAIKITSLKAFELKNCYKLETIDSWKHLKSLEELTLSDCSELELLSSLAEMTSLKYFQLEKCSKLKKIEGLENIKSLEKLRISDCLKLEVLPEITSLKKLQLRKCHKLEKIRGLRNMKSLNKLNISDCSELKVALPEIASLKTLQLENWHMKIEGLENMRSLEKLNISDCSELEALPEITSLKILELKKCAKLKKMEGLQNMRLLEKLYISGCAELEALPNLSEISSLEELQLENCYKLQKIEGLERLGRLRKLKVHTRWNVPCIVSLDHCKSLQWLDVVANDISAVEPFVRNCNIQTWSETVMICTRPVGDVGLLKNLFQNMPNVSVLDYTDVVEVDSFFGRKCLKLTAPERSANADAILRCFIIDSDHPSLRLSIESSTLYGDFHSDLGQGIWVWMGVSTRLGCGLINEDYISARDSEGEDVKVRVDAAWAVTGEEGSIVDAFHHHFQRQLPDNSIQRSEMSYYELDEMSCDELDEEKRSEMSLYDELDEEERAQMSYDELDEEEKQMFLDTACFFIGEEKSLAIAVWDGSEWSGLKGWESLVSKDLSTWMENIEE